jgi:hypothetical protein
LFSRCSLQRYFKNWNKTSKFPCFAPTSLSSSHSFSINFANQTDSQPMPTSAPCPAVAGTGQAASDGPMTCTPARRDLYEKAYFRSSLIFAAAGEAFLSTMLPFLSMFVSIKDTPYL